MFPIGILSGIAAWLFKRETALLILLFGLIHHFINFEYFADTYIVYQNRLNAPISCILLIFTISAVKKHLHYVRAVNSQLENMVRERDIELQILTDELMQSAEDIKIYSARILHDGLGQHLTGAHLLSTSLSTKLLTKGHTGNSLADQLSTSVQQTHNQIRQIARLLFPIRIGIVGLTAALHELASCLESIKPIRVKVDALEDMDQYGERLSLQAYRICQEFCLCVINMHQTKTLDIELRKSESNMNICIQYDGKPFDLDQTDVFTQLIQYRLKQVSGSMHAAFIKKKTNQLTIEIPCP